MKDIFIEIYNHFNGQIPINFNYDDYIKNRLILQTVKLKTKNKNK